MTGRKTGCNRSRPVFFGFSIFQQTLQLATEKNQNLCNRNWWSGLLQLGSVRFWSFFQSSELDLRTLMIPNGTHGIHWNSVGIAWETALKSLSKIVQLSRIDHLCPRHITCGNKRAFLQLHYATVRSMLTNFTNTCCRMAMPKVNISIC